MFHSDAVIMNETLKEIAKTLERLAYSLYPIWGSTEYEPVKKEEDNDNKHDTSS